MYESSYAKGRTRSLLVGGKAAGHDGLVASGCGHARLDATGLNRGAAGGQTEIKY